MDHVKAICLDLDDTLWDLGPVIEQAERAVLDWFDLHYPRITQRFSLQDMRAMRRAVEAEFPGRSHDLPLLRRTTFSRLAGACGYTEDPSDAAFAEFQRARNRVTPYPDVHPALARLARRAPLVALTDGTADLRVIGLSQYFTAVVTAADAGAAKPDPRAFRLACHRLGLEPGQVLHAGDHPEKDVGGARALGMTAVWVRRSDRDWPPQLPDPEHMVADMAELAQLLGA